MELASGNKITLETKMKHNLVNVDVTHQYGVETIVTEKSKLLSLNIVLHDEYCVHFLCSMSFSLPFFHFLSSSSVELTALPFFPTFSGRIIFPFGSS